MNRLSPSSMAPAGLAGITPRGLSSCRSGLFFGPAGWNCQQSAPQPHLGLVGVSPLAGNHKALWIVPEAGDRRVVQARPERHIGTLPDLVEGWRARRG